MSPSPLAEAHIEGQRRLRAHTTAAVGAAWTNLGSWRDPDVDRFLSQALPVVDAGQRASANLTNAYLARFMGRQALPMDPARVTGAGVRSGTPPHEVYRRPFVTLWAALGEGKDFSDALSTALARVEGTAALDVQLSMRAAAQAVQEADDGIYGYVRVADGSACEFCSAIDGAYIKDADASPLHNNCGCGVEPLTTPHPRAAFLPSGESVHRDFALREHGEVGLVLTAPDQHFTSL